MRYFKLIYSYNKELQDYIEFLNDEEMDKTEDEKLAIAKADTNLKYIHYHTNVIYTEDDNRNGNAIRVIDIVEMYPDDWIEVTEEEYLNAVTDENPDDEDANLDL